MHFHYLTTTHFRVQLHFVPQSINWKHVPDQHAIIFYEDHTELQLSYYRSLQNNITHLRSTQPHDVSLHKIHPLHIRKEHLL